MKAKIMTDENESRQDILAQAIVAVLVEARKSELGASSQQDLIYTGGLRRAAKILDDMLSELQREKGT